MQLIENFNIFSKQQNTFRNYIIVKENNSLQIRKISMKVILRNIGEELKRKLAAQET